MSNTRIFGIDGVVIATSRQVYMTRDDAIQIEIIEPIEASGIITDARAAYDIDAIADEVLGDYDDGYACQVGEATFWHIVAAHEIND